MGFEPTISGVTGRHVNRYTTAPRNMIIAYLPLFFNTDKMITCRPRPLISQQPGQNRSNLRESNKYDQTDNNCQ